VKERRGPHNLKTLAETTGGAVFTAFRLADLQRIVHTIGVAVRYSYIVGYEPPSQESVAHPKRLGWLAQSQRSTRPAGKIPGLRGVREAAILQRP
jgi:hypothetical protein